ncbi:interleukin-8-like [Chiloscyllium plagiosum]|uniref:interleukin-8-like n=1 Tax=Chiloscyllium plagiosum TaxID=36176 RepID=UPI001CB81374|nr:interleukin-8-like [Chiloscyllium plagiosum]
MKTQTIYLLLTTIVISLAAQGLCMGKVTHSRCRCAAVIARFISPKKYQHIDIYPQGSFCRKVEIIITLKDGMKVCVNPKSNWVKKVINLMNEETEDSTASN